MICGINYFEIAILTSPKPRIYRNLYENTDPRWLDTMQRAVWQLCLLKLPLGMTHFQFCQFWKVNLNEAM